jgi:hypothetical protein
VTTGDGTPKRDVAGAAWRGTVAAMAMSGMRELTMSLGLVGRPPPDEVAAEGLPGMFARVPMRYRDGAIELAHWSYGAGMGIAYGLLPRSLRRRSWLGPAYGLATWAVFERAVAPALGLRAASERPVAERAAIALDHVLYGTIVGHRALDPTA